MGKRAIAQFVRRSDRPIFISQFVVACHNTLTLELAKPNIFLLLASDWSLLQQHIP
ncbi:hypothetical protein [uncultured Nostoc sp.]|uniref:hypothetical protein n=1 Tax=uncultured Nostoc sp. TaxID=340711 RepID=UPI0035C969A6